MMRGTSAGFGRRFAALLYDALLLAALLLTYTAVVVAVRGRGLTAASGAGWYLYRAGELAIVTAYYVVNWMHSGQTLGMRAWSLSVVEQSGRPLRLTAALWRCVCGALAWAPAALGVLWLYADEERAAIHDRLSGTRVLRLSSS